MKKHRLERYKSGKQFLTHARRSENYSGEKVEGSHHTVYSMKGGFVIIPVHGNKDLATGTRISILKRMLAIGLSILAMTVIAFALFGGVR